VPSPLRPGSRTGEGFIGHPAPPWHVSLVVEAASSRARREHPGQLAWMSGDLSARVPDHVVEMLLVEVLVVDLAMSQGLTKCPSDQVPPPS
jgi:hypothetical protein